MPDFSTYPIWLNLVVVAGAGAVIWFAGTRLAEDADVIADRTGLGQAFVGLVLLAVATSLPEDCHDDHGVPER
jgi:cation:H+ antiporter